MTDELKPKTTVAAEEEKAKAEEEPAPAAVATDAVDLGECMGCGKQAMHDCPQCHYAWCELSTCWAGTICVDCGGGVYQGG